MRCKRFPFFARSRASETGRRLLPAAFLLLSPARLACNMAIALSLYQMRSPPPAPPSLSVGFLTGPSETLRVRDSLYASDWDYFAANNLDVNNFHSIACARAPGLITSPIFARERKRERERERGRQAVLYLVREIAWKCSCAFADLNLTMPCLYAWISLSGWKILHVERFSFLHSEISKDSPSDSAVHARFKAEV